MSKETKTAEVMKVAQEGKPNAEATAMPVSFVEETDKAVESRLVSEITMITRQTKQMVLYNSIEIGRRLSEAKKIVKHGQWTKWLKERVDYSQRTATNFIKIYEQYGESGLAAKSQSIADLSYTQALTLLELPEPERQRFAEQNNAKDMTIKELQSKVKSLLSEKQTAETQLSQAEQKQKELAESNARLLARKEEETETLRKRIRLLEQQAREAEFAKKKEVREEIEKSLKEQQDKLSALETDKKRLREEIATAREERKKAVMQAREEERVAAKLTIEGKNAEIEKIKADMQRKLKKAAEETASVSTKLKAETAKNSIAGDLAKSSMLIENVLDGYAELMDLIMSIKDANREEGDSLLSDLENGLEKIRKKAHIKLVVAK